jgi:hypothetical protein
MEVLEFYKDYAGNFNVLGKVLIMPIIILCFPLLLLISLCMKD